jgi:hypothetical protein
MGIAVFAGDLPFPLPDAGRGEAVLPFLPVI